MLNTSERLRDQQSLYVQGLELIPLDKLEPLLRHSGEEYLANAVGARIPLSYKKGSCAWQGPVLPEDVKGFFQNHPEEESYAFQGYIYFRPLLKPKEQGSKDGLVSAVLKAVAEPLFGNEVTFDPNPFRRIKKRISSLDYYALFSRHKDMTPDIRRLLQDNAAVRDYFENVKKLSGSTVDASVLLPPWQAEEISLWKTAYTIPGEDELMLQIGSERVCDENGLTLKIIDRLDEGLCTGNGELEIGRILCSVPGKWLWDDKSNPAST